MIIIFFAAVMLFFVPISNAAIETGASVCIFAWGVRQVWGRARDKAWPAAGLFAGRFALLNQALVWFVLASALSIFFSSNVPLSLKAFFFKLSEYVLLFVVLQDTLSTFALPNEQIRSQDFARRQGARPIHWMGAPRRAHLARQGRPIHRMGAPTQHTGKRRLISVQSVAQRLINTPRRYRGLVWVLLFSLLFIGLDGVFQKIFDIDLFRRRHMFSHIRVTASFINPNDLGSFLVTLLPLPLALLFSGIGRNVKVFLAAIFFIGIAVLLLTFSKGALAAFLLSLLFLAFCLRRRLVFLIFAVVIVLMFTLPLLFHGGCDWASRLSSFFSDCGVKDRIFLWRAALRMFLAHPFFGVGLGTFMENYQLYWIRPTAEISYAHNCYLQTLAETGIIGLGTFVAFLSVWVIRVCGVIRKQPPAGTKGDGFVYFSVLGLAAGLVAYLLNSFVDTNFYALPLAVLFWSVLGVQVAGMKILCRKE